MNHGPTELAVVEYAAGPARGMPANGFAVARAMLLSG